MSTETHPKAVNNTLVDQIWPSQKRLHLRYTLREKDVFSMRRLVSLENSLLTHPELKHLSFLPEPELVLE